MQKEEFIRYIKEFDAIVKEELKISDADVEVQIEASKNPEFVIDEFTQCDLVEALYACPHGVLAMAQDIENFVETSTNLASVKMINNQIKVVTSQRSSVESKKEDACNMVASVFNLMNAEVEHSEGYPGWTPNPNSEVLTVLKQAYLNLFKRTFGISYSCGT